MKKRILIIDDEMGITQILSLNLERTGQYTVRAENFGSRALSSARQFKPDLILLDVMMPEIGGGEIAEKIRDDEQLKNVPIVFLTAVVRKEEVEANGGIIGGFPYVAKPLNVARIIDTIEENLNRRN